MIAAISINLQSKLLLIGGNLRINKSFSEDFPNGGTTHKNPESICPVVAVGRMPDVPQSHPFTAPFAPLAPL
jgi:hypothetical protein